MSAILIVPAWTRPGAAIDYQADDGSWWPAVVAFLKAESVVIELSDGQLWDVSPEAFAEGTTIRRSTAPNRVRVAAWPLQNVTRVGRG